MAIALAALPYEHRYAIERAYFNGLSASAIATESGVPLSTIKGRMRLALRKLALDIDLRLATATAMA